MVAGQLTLPVFITLVFQWSTIFIAAVVTRPGWSQVILWTGVLNALAVFTFAMENALFLAYPHHERAEGIGMMIRAGVDDRAMLGATGVNVQVVFAFVFAIGAGLAGFAGVVGGTALSIAPGEDVRYLLASLVVVIVGGMGSVPGAAIGALLIGRAEQFGLAYSPTYGVVYTFLIMVAVLALRPQGIMGQRA